MSITDNLLQKPSKLAIAADTGQVAKACAV
jgi:hypothetical protein